MIYTVTFNPSIDYAISLDEFTLGQTNRSISEYICSGGKGINVSMVLKNLDIENIALGFIAGFTGKEIEREINEFGCKTDFIVLKNGLSRINVKLKYLGETEINAIGPFIDNNSLEELFVKLSFLKNDDILVLAGSIPTNLSQNIYEDIINRLKGKNIHLIVDATKDLLLNVLKYKPFLIKPNIDELSQLFNTKIESYDDIIYYSKELQQRGAQNVLISMGKQGAVFITYSGEIYKSYAPLGVVKNTVGSGDSMIAGFLAGYIEKNDFKNAFFMGLAAGSASAFSDKLATKDEILKIYRSLDL